MNERVSVIIPVYNEEKTIGEIIRRVEKAAPNAEIIVVNDGSSDKTKQILEKLPKNKIVLINQTNQGKGAAIRNGLKAVNEDYIIIQDADLEYDPEDYPQLIEPLKKGKAKVVYGSRFLGAHLNLLFWHRVANSFLNLFANLLYNTTLSDFETGYKAFKSEIIKTITLRANRFDFEPEVTAKILKKGVYIYEVPISYVGRDYKDGKKITFKDGLFALWALLYYRFSD